MCTFDRIRDQKLFRIEFQAAFPVVLSTISWISEIIGSVVTQKMSITPG